MDKQSNELPNEQSVKTEELKKVTFMLDVIKRYDHYIGTINVKAGLLFSFIVVVIWNVTKYTAEITASGCLTKFLFVLAFVVILSGILSTYYLLSSIFPNLSSSSYKRSLIFYGDVSKKYADKKEYIKEVNAASVDDVLDDLAGQAYDISNILLEKFSRQKQAVNWLKFVMLPSFFTYVFTMLWIGSV
ncbi:Pycsar system effector family protein [Shewanella scandinavica]|uniref:DUF5706 domain-containing protein n=1 Tax=Shewanella scandinavica TaxID=3063538 RepID=A0ABU3FYD8_9GAMM|nr:Pycsar system effector family protein [Shewanella sp. SP2S1-2]MDT3280371.1 DUF5706 domain-containing protein [Shewanella sp. SP2S1-2]